MRFVNSHATHSGGGESSAMRQLEANAEQALERKHHPLVRCALGFHASFACDDALLSRLGRLRGELGVGVHGHLAESEEDVAKTLRDFGQRIVPRLDAQGLLGRGCIAAFASAIDRVESERLAKTGTMVVLSPLRDAMEEPTGAGWASLLPEGLISLGTAGSTLLRDEIASAFASMIQWARLGGGLDPDARMGEFLRGTPAAFGSAIFGEPLGQVEPGNQADLVVYDLLPSADGTAGLGGLLLQIALSPVAWTIVAGRVVVREGRVLAHDFRELAKDAQRALQSIASRAGAPSASALKSGPQLP
jgi:cytosine/adenosine deaminase-related metal-dependent hydrolase